MMHRMPPHHMKQVHARLEGTHHSGRGLVEHPGCNVIKQMTFELKVDDKIDLCRVSDVCRVADRTERPRVCQVLQRPIDGVHEHLSRSIQRDTVVRRWTGWAVRPTVAWALSLLMAVGVTAVTLVWKIENRAGQTAPSTVVESTNPEPTADAIEVGPERSLFDDVVSLGEEQQEQLRKMLESAENGTYTR